MRWLQLAASVGRWFVLCLAVLLVIPALAVGLEDQADGLVAGRSRPRFLEQGRAEVLGLVQPPPVGCGAFEFYGYTILSGIQFYPPAMPSSPPPKAHLALSGTDVFWSDASSTPINKASFDARTIAPLAIRIGEVESFVINGQSIYWEDAPDGPCSTRRAIHKSAIDGSTTFLLAAGSNCSSEFPTTDFVVDDSNVYFVTSQSNPKSYAIKKVPVGGGAATTLAVAGLAAGGAGPDQRAIVGLAADAANIYWEENDFAGGTLLTIPKSGGAATVVATGLTSLRGGLLVQGTNLLLADSDGFSVDRVLSVPTAGGAVTVLAQIADSSSAKAAIRLASDGNKVYWTDSTTVNAVPIGGGASSTLATGLVRPIGLAADGTSVIWTERQPITAAPGSVKKVPASGGSVTTLTSSADLPGTVWSDGTSAYWAEGGRTFGDEGAGAGAIRKVPVAGGPPTTVLGGVGSSFSPIVTDGVNVYVADGWRIKRVPVAGGMVEKLGVAASAVTDIATDGAFVYWAESAPGGLRNVLIGGGAPTTLVSGLLSPEVLRVDPTSVYWFNHSSSEIKEVGKAGGTPTTLFPAGSWLSDLAVDGVDVFFSTDTGSIAKLPVGGGSTTSIGSGGSVWNRLALNSTSAYWVMQGRVSRAPKTGGVQALVADGLASDPGLPDAIVADDTSIYFTNVANGWIVLARQLPTNAVRFSAESYAVAESAPTASISLERLGYTRWNTTVDYATLDGSAVAGKDYTPTSGTLTFGPGIARKIVSVPILRDSTVAGDKTVLLRLSDPVGCASLFSPDTAVLTIKDVDVAGSVQFSAATYTVNEAGPFATITVTRAGGAASGVTVDYETSGGTATPAEDYTPTTGTLTFGAGVKSRTFAVPILDDGGIEGNSTVGLVLSTPKGGASLGPQSSAVLTIQEDNPVLQFGAANYAISEGASKATITVARLGPTTGTATVHYQTADGSAHAGQSYEPASGILTFGPGAKSRTFTVMILNDKIHEDGETVLLTLDNPSAGSALGQQSTAVLSITDNDPPGTITFSAASYTVAETAAQATVTVRRKAGTAEGVQVRYDASGGTATPNVDYTPTSGDLTFSAAGTGAVSQPFAVPILMDGSLDGEKTVNLTLTNPQGVGVLGTPSAATLMILSVDPLVQFSAATYKAIESGTDPVIAVRRSGPKTGSLTVHYDVSGGSATPNVDYVPASGDLSFGPGITTQSLSVHLLKDPAVDGAETVDLSLSNPVGGGLGKQATAILTIASTDPGVSFSVSTYKVAEAAPKATITVKRTAPISSPVSVDYETADGTATAGVDYESTAGTLSFPKGSSTRSFPVNIINDRLDEPGAASTIALTLKNPAGAYLGSPSVATLQISDNDAAGTVQFAASDYSVRETRDFATITVVRSGGSAGGVKVHYATSDGTAVAGSSYTSTFGDLTFNPGDTSQTFTIPVLDDGSAGNKTVHLALTSPQGGATLGAKVDATLWIVDQN